MDDNNSPKQENQKSGLIKLPEPNVYESQSRTQPPVTEPPAPKKSRKLLLIAVLLVLLFAVGGAAAYFMTQDDEPSPVETVQTSEETDGPAEETVADVTFQSTLYSDLSFTVPEGWEVSEPETYDDNVFGKGSADGTITVRNGDIVLKLDLEAVRATGFEGYTCYDWEGLTVVGDVYRFVDPEGVLFYINGITEADEEWAEIIADEGNFTYFEDPNPNFCVSFPFIGTYSSTLNQADYPDYPYGFTDQQKAIVWLSALIDGAPTVSQLADADAIIKSLSQPDLGI